MSKEKLEQLIKDAHYSMSTYEYLGGMLINQKRENGETPEYKREMNSMLKNYYMQLIINAYAVKELADLKGIVIDLDKPDYMSEIIDFDLNEYRITDADMIGFSHVFKGPLTYEELNESGCVTEFIELVRFHSERIEDELMVEKLGAK